MVASGAFGSCAMLCVLPAVITLAPVRDAAVQALDDRRVYEVYPGSRPGSFTDFDGRKISHQAGELEISGAPARVTLR